MFMPRLLGAVALVGIVTAAGALPNAAGRGGRASRPVPGCGRAGAASRGSR